MGILKAHTGNGKVHLGEIDPGFHDGLDRASCAAATAVLHAELTEIQELMYAAGLTGMLIVLQGLDSAGKDGTIAHVMSAVNPQGCRVAGFKVPTPEEASHDFLWRVHPHAPPRGVIAIFNRSHYEDVLAVRVHNLVPTEVWRARYAQINHFENLLVDSQTVILKFFLHISKEEQKERLLEREKTTETAWKLSAGDWHERTFWSDYHRAYEEAIETCSTPHAPWFIVPADHKWFRNYVITEAIVEALRPYRPSWEKHLKQVGVAAREELQKMRLAGGADADGIAPDSGKRKTE
ncbi:MAG: polyphosphate kinase 2 family protein [Armatimonadetes bacterium]|nr:polyphosphate kinase 2 family protein [Armatimonadota bacterium]MDE2206619.1 polyphosphate kinase 2 family protein [Armatimonadota bacterium]